MEKILFAIQLMLLLYIITSQNSINKKIEKVNKQINTLNTSQEFDIYHKKVSEYMKNHCDENITYEVRLLAHREKKNDEQEKIFTIKMDEFKN